MDSLPIQSTAAPTDRTHLQILIGNRIQAVRKERGLTQTHLARRANFRRHSSIWRIEAGRHLPTLELLRSLAAALDCNVSDLLPDADSWILAPLQENEDDFELQIRKLARLLTANDREVILRCARQLSLGRRPFSEFITV